MQHTKKPVKPSIEGVVWKDSTFGRAIKERVVPVRSRRLPVVSSQLEPHMVVGRPMIVTRNLVFGDQGVYPFPVLRPSTSKREGTCVVVKGSLIVYTGTVRSTERKKVQGRQRALEVIKHTFITPVGRCIIHDFTVFAPA